jgi:hypothetical protein
MGKTEKDAKKNKKDAKPDVTKFAERENKQAPVSCMRARAQARGAGLGQFQIFVFVAFPDDCRISMLVRVGCKIHVGRNATCTRIMGMCIYR